MARRFRRNRAHSAMRSRLLERRQELIKLLRVHEGHLGESSELVSWLGDAAELATRLTHGAWLDAPHGRTGGDPLELDAMLGLASARGA